MQKSFLFLTLFVLMGGVQAETLKGRIAEISPQAGTIVIQVEGKGREVIGTDADTRYEGAAGLNDLGPPDLIEVQRQEGGPAARIRKVLFDLPPGLAISINELLGIITDGQPHQLYDTRPHDLFATAHIPGAGSTSPEDEDFPGRLPADKDMLLVFYGRGPTFPDTAAAVEQAEAAGHTNLKGYLDGLPGWSETRLLLLSEASWLAKHRNPRHVVLDVRPRTVSSRSHIVGAVAMPLSELQAMSQRTIAGQESPRLPGLSDRGAPVIVYADDHTSREAVRAYKLLREWGYDRATVLKNGFTGWRTAGLPTVSGPAATRIVYENDLAPAPSNPRESGAAHSPPPPVRAVAGLP
ncbi:MAG: rhodanese-like domain-containing protein [Gammaproteobacteria bacterium]|nr:rhodanese-like domain-containing protein [Gammaproteobacteria bacterium]